MKNYKMDLHVHTPASKCYKEEKTDEKYFEILKKAVEEGIDILAITDHNTIDGYKHLYEIKKRIIFEKETLLPFREKDRDINARITKIEEIIELYNKLWIIPGVEITLNPGVHMLVLSSDENIEDLSALLDEAGYTEGQRGSDSDLSPNMDVKSFLRSPFLKDKLVIAPHVDSAQGIYNELKGMYRADVFKSSEIHAITCNSIGQLEKIQSLVKNDVNYKREKLWAYINASDAHAIDEIGKKVSYIKLEKRKFELLVDAFENSSEKITDVEDPEIEEFISKLVKSQKMILLADIEAEEYELEKAICAAMNSGYHGIIYGVDHKMNITGVNVLAEKMKEILKAALQELKGIKRNKVGLLEQNLGNGRSVYILIIRRVVNTLCYLPDRDETYIYEKGIKKASIFEIENIVKRTLMQDISRFQKNNDDNIEQIRKSIVTLKQPLDRYSIATAVENEAVYLNEVMEVELRDKSKNMNKWDELEFSIGDADGKVFFAKNERIRLEDGVLRYTCPNQSKDVFTEIEIRKMNELKQSCVVITKQGASYLAEKREEGIYIDGDEMYITLTLKEEYKEKYSLYAMVAWLKSSAFIWYMQRVCGKIDIFKPEIFKQIVIPKNICLHRSNEVDKLVLEIINLEDDLLKRVEIARQSEGEKTIEDINNMIDEHNELICEKARAIDDIIFVGLGMNEKQKQIVSEDLEITDIFNYLDK